MLRFPETALFGKTLCAKRMSQNPLCGSKAHSAAKPSKKSPRRYASGTFFTLNCAGYFARAQAPGTDVHMAGSTIDDCLHALDVGFPSPIGPSVGVGNLNPEGHALVAKLTLSHPQHLLAGHTFVHLIRATSVIIAWFLSNCKRNFRKFPKFFRRGRRSNEPSPSLARRVVILSSPPCAGR